MIDVQAIVEALVPAIREVIRQELTALKPLDEYWYSPVEVAAMSCGRVRAETLRKWLRWGQIDGESDGEQVRIYQSAVEELRKNKWRPTREPDPDKLPPSLKRK
jgi:lysyl-tRNA synthetase class I